MDHRFYDEGTVFDALKQADRLNKENVDLRAQNYKSERKLEEAMEIIKELRSKPEDDTEERQEGKERDAAEM
eukprot:764261-Hanusia_phi.AAC.3